jgi:hypothetical protein
MPFARRGWSISTRSSATSFERCRAVVRVPWDDVLQAGAEVSLSDLRPATRAAYLELSAKVAQGFAEPGRRL